MAYFNYDNVTEQIKKTFFDAIGWIRRYIYNILAIAITIIVSEQIVYWGMYSNRQYHEKEDANEARKDSIREKIITNQNIIKYQLDTILMDNKIFQANSDSIIVLQNEISKNRSIIIYKQ